MFALKVKVAVSMRINEGIGADVLLTPTSVPTKRNCPEGVAASCKLVADIA